MWHFFGFFLWEFLSQFAVNPLLIGPLALVGAVVLLRLGNGMGLDWIFWHDQRRVRIVNGVALGVLYGTVLLVGFLLSNGRHPQIPSHSDDRPFEAMKVYWVGITAILAIAAAIAMYAGHRRTRKTKGPAPRARERDTGPDAVRIEQLDLPAAFAVTVLILFGLIQCLTFAEPGITRHPLPSFLRWIFALGRFAGTPEPPAQVEYIHLLATIVLILQASYWVVMRRRPDLFTATAASSLCSLLSLICLIGGMLEFNAFPLWLVVVAGFAIAAFAAWRAGPFTNPVRGLGQRPVQPLAKVDPDNQRITPPPLPALPTTGHLDIGSGVKRPLAIVCCSGGGIRAGVWTIRTLMNLQTLTGADGMPLIPDFSKHLRLIFGASGGMLGATRFVTWLAEEQPVGAAEAIAHVEAEALSELTAQLIFRDIPQSFSPVPTKQHRGNVIEDNWCRNFQWKDQRTFQSLATGESAGEVPSIVFSPMMVEDGRRLIISNLDLAPLTRFDGPEVAPPKPGEPDHTHQLYSRSAVQLRDLFGTDAVTELNLMSAVRLNATFPYVMPISSIPTEPRRRVVDAGYYDNYGVSLAADWLQFTLDDPSRRKWFEDHVSGVVVIQIRDGILDLTLPISSVHEAPPNPVTLAVEPLTGPVQGLLGFRDAVQLFNNDSRLSHTLARINRAKPSQGNDFATTVSFEFGLSASLSWALSADDQKNLREESESQPFRQRVEMLGKWWRSHSGS